MTRDATAKALALRQVKEGLLNLRTRADLRSRPGI